MPAGDRPVPKGLIQVGDETLLERSLRLLRQYGVERIVLVTGFESERLIARFGGLPGVEFVHSPDFCSTESFWSLKLALDVADGPLLLLECDLFYDGSFLGELLAGDAEDAMLISTATHSGDEVWASGRAGCVIRLSKNRRELVDVCGEIVGISRFSKRACDSLRSIFNGMSDSERQTATYDDVALNRLFPLCPVRVVEVCGERWGEIDDVNHYRRVVGQVLPIVTGAFA